MELPLFYHHSFFFPLKMRFCVCWWIFVLVFFNSEAGVTSVLTIDPTLAFSIALDTFLFSCIDLVSLTTTFFSRKTFVFFFPFFPFFPTHLFD